jgi:hypothetical protein
MLWRKEGQIQRLIDFSAAPPEHSHLAASTVFVPSKAGPEWKRQVSESVVSQPQVRDLTIEPGK